MQEYYGVKMYMCANLLSAVPSPPTVSIDPFNSLEMAGQPLTLNCLASIQEGIRGTPVLTWTREDASLPSDITSAPPLLSFSSLRTSHAGRYTCTARLIIPEAGVDVPGTTTTSVFMQCIIALSLFICIDFPYILPQLSLHLPSSMDLHGTPVFSKA